MKHKIIIVILLMLLVIPIFSSIYATYTQPAQSLTDAWWHANNFLDISKGTSGVGSEIGSIITGQIMPLLSTVGNTIVAIVTVFLGIKYIWSGSDAKAAIKNSLPNYLVGIIFFYLPYSLVKFLIIDPNNPSTASLGLFGKIFSGSSYDTMSSNLLGAVATIVQFASVVGVVVLGIRYMLTSSNEKADFKESMAGIVLGIAFAFGAGSIVKLIIAVAGSVLK